MSYIPQLCNHCGATNRPQASFCISCGKPQTLAGGQTNTSRTGLLTPHHLLKQRYHIIIWLGQGGFGAVYKAKDTQLGDRLLAVKEMSQSNLSPQEITEATENFRREALLLAGLKHQNLPSIYDHFGEAGRWYLVMDFIEGETLEEHLNKKQGGHFSVEETLQLGIQLCTVLGYLHSRQPPIIFRDLKPPNVMVTADSHLYLIDFGIARLFKPGQTKDTTAFGSQGYAAPEQYGKAQTTASADIYSLGVTLHQLLSGIDPSLDPFQFAPLHLGNQPGFASLEALIMQMLETRKDKRPSSMTVVKQELQRIMQQVAGSPATITPSTLAPVQKTKEQWLDEGNKLLTALRYQEALAAFEETLRLDPNDAFAYSNKGCALNKLGRHQEALVAYEQALRLDPNDANAYSQRGFSLNWLGRYQEALTACEQAILLNPNDAFAHRQKGHALNNLGRCQEALTACERSILLNPNDAFAYSHKGDALNNLGRYQEALAAYEQALAACERSILLNPNDASAYINKGDALINLGRYQEALAACEQALRLDPNNAFAYINKGYALNNLGRYQEALTAYEQALRLDPNDTSAYNNKGWALNNLGRYQEALTAYEQALRLDPNDTFAHEGKNRALNNLRPYH